MELLIRIISSEQVGENRWQIDGLFHPRSGGSGWTSSKPFDLHRTVRRQFSCSANEQRGPYLTIFQRKRLNQYFYGKGSLRMGYLNNFNNKSSNKYKKFKNKVLFLNIFFYL
jgi:hypothetical protein